MGERQLVSPIDWAQIPIPKEIDDLEDFLKSEMIKELDVNQYQTYTPFVRDLVAAVDETWTQKTLQTNFVELRRRYKINPKKSGLIEVYRSLVRDGTIRPNRYFERVIRKRTGRTASGVAVITTLLGPGKFSCPMNCKYCPNDPAISRSYLLNEPAVRRGFKNGWDPINQFMSCANRLYKTGHEVTKVEIIIEGGTFGSYPHDYIDEYFRDLYYAANILDTAFNTQCGRTKLSLEEEIDINQTADCAIIGITVETRPDWINRKEIQRFRRLGVTRVQLGIQHLDDKILDIVDRKCPTKKTVRAIRLLKENGFKVDGHFMPDLPGSSYAKDRQMFEFLFSSANEDIQCDQLKIYPTMTTDYTEILEWYKEGKYKPYAENNGGREITDLLNYISLNVPPWIRLNRIVRDIPVGYIKGGLKRVNLRQDVDDGLHNKGLIPRDIRGREVKGRAFNPDASRIWIDVYKSSGGTDYFISYENADRTILYGFVRLRLSNLELHQSKDYRFFPCLKNAALIRELHVYGELIHQSNNNTGLGPSGSYDQTQHLGIGRKLMATAENIAYDHGFRTSAVIAGVGVRRYYQKLGYHLEDTYMVKTLVSPKRSLNIKEISFGLMISIILILALIVFQSNNIVTDIVPL